MINIKAPLDFIKQQKSVNNISAPAGTIICNTGDQCQNLIFLIEGQVRVYRPAEDGRSITLYHIEAGESCILTTSCILNDASFPAIAEVEKDAIGLVIPASEVHIWLKEHPIWQSYILNLLSQRMGDLISLVDALAFKNLDARLGKWLLKHAQKQPEIQTTHQFIADELASSREVISRLLKELERDQLITLSRGKITIVNIERVAKLAHTM